MCTNALNCTHSPLIDGPELRRSTRQILELGQARDLARLNYRSTVLFVTQFLQ